MHGKSIHIWKQTIPNLAASQEAFPSLLPLQLS